MFMANSRIPGPLGITIIANFGSQIHAVKYQRGGEDVPAISYLKDRSGSYVWRMDILRGSHTAITFINSRGEKITSNNPDNAVSMDPAVWIDAAPHADPRHIFFYGLRNTLTDKRNSHTTLFHVGTVQPRPVVLQVRVINPPGQSIGSLKLYGKSMSLNSKGLRSYKLELNKEISSSKLPTEVINDVSKEGKLVHLVINAHGQMTVDGATIHLGKGFSHKNVNLWEKLSGKVNYIWFLNCWVGNDNLLFSSIAQKTGAWVSAYPAPLWSTPSNVPSKHIDYGFSPTMKHWAGKTGKLVGADEFFRSARHREVASLNSSLHFNLLGLL